MTQHGGLDAERWSQFDLDQQVLMIANEMNRVAHAIVMGRESSRRAGYERVLRLVDLTVSGCAGMTLRRELLRWRDLAAELYLRDEADPAGHRAAFRALLLFTPVAAKQLPLLAATMGG